MQLHIVCAVQKNTICCGYVAKWHPVKSVDNF
jgi:hypothetical protein